MDLGICHYRLNNLRTARERYQWAFEESERLEWTEGIAGALLNLGLVDRVEAQWEMAERHLLRAKKSFAELGLMRGYTLAVLNLGLQRLWKGSLAVAEEDLTVAARLAAEIGDNQVESTARMDRGLALVRMGRMEEARQELARAIRLCRQQSSPRRLAIALEYL